MSKHPPSVPHDQVVQELLAKRPGLAAAYLHAAAEEATDEVGRVVFLRALRQVAKAQGMSWVADAAGIKVQSLSRALSDRGNPTLSTIVAVAGSLGMRMTLVDVAAAEPKPGGKGGKAAAGRAAKGPEPTRA